MTFIALPDNLALMTDVAKKANHPPLFSSEDLQGVMSLAQGINYGQEINLGPNFSVVLHDAGHILGSSIIEFRAEGKKIYFSGDLGNPPTPLLRPFEYPLEADYIVIESAYGDRVHEDRSTRKEKLRSIVKETILKRRDADDSVIRDGAHPGIAV